MNQVREAAQFRKLPTKSGGREKLFDKVDFLWKTLEIFRKKIGKICDVNILHFSKNQVIFIYSSHVRPLEKSDPQDFVVEAVVLSDMGHISSWCCGLWWPWQKR